MEPTAPATPSASPADPPPDRPGNAIPGHIALLLHAARTLLGYGRHLLDTVTRRAANPNFNAIAASFGTANLATILAHLNRGILRAVAMERVLLARAATGRDIDIVARRGRTPPAPPAPAAPQAEQPAEQPAARTLVPRPSRPAGWNDPELFMPTLQDLERQVRRRALGRTVLDICLDLAVVPGFCTGEFWNELYDIMNSFGGSVATLMQRKSHRQTAFVQELDRKRGSNWDWLRLQRDGARRILGFFIGEPPVDPLEPEAAIATGPP